MGKKMKPQGNVNIMEEKTLKSRKNGMVALICTTLVYLLGIAMIILGGIRMGETPDALAVLLLVFGLVIVAIGWIPYLGLRILKPQEALVLTLFGKYIGTLKGDGFYFVNPFCVSVNPAAKTRLNQSGDVKSGDPTPVRQVMNGGTVELSLGQADRKISLKLMTLNNNRQKVNDCLGTPVEIGIAVTWRIVDTAKAVFNVDNYKEFLSLQCDSALRNIVRIYPYDVAPGVDTTGDGAPDDGSLRGSSELVAEPDPAGDPGAGEHRRDRGGGGTDHLSCICHRDRGRRCSSGSRRPPLWMPGK